MPKGGKLKWKQQELLLLQLSLVSFFRCSLLGLVRGQRITVAKATTRSIVDPSIFTRLISIGGIMTTKHLMNDKETIRFFRAVINRNDIRIVERRKKKDRRIAFFSFIHSDRRFLPERRMS